MDGSLTMKTVTVVITCYNYAKYVAAAIRSCQEQTYPVAEIIVVNDGSTDESETIIQGFLSDPRIQYVFQSNQGQTKAKNVGIARSTADVIAFLDADDFWENDKLAKQLPLFDDPQVGVVYSRARFIDEDSQALDMKVDSAPLFPQRGWVSDPLFVDNFVPFSSAVVRRTCVDHLGVFDESLRMGIDWDLWLRYSTAWRFDFVDEPLLVYRVGHPGQMSKNAEERMRCSDRIMQNFLQRFPQAVSARACRKAAAYTCVNRGKYYAQNDRWHALRYYLQSIWTRPLQKAAYGALLRLVCRLPSG